MSVETIISLVLVAVLIVSYIGLRIVRKRNGYNPDLEQEREEENRRERLDRKRDSEAEEYMLYSGREYGDD